MAGREIIRAAVRTARRHARALLKPPLHRPDIKLPHVVLGSDYGGWPLLTDETPRQALVYSFGVGEDITFDLAAIERFGCEVHGFDPTPRSRAWVARQDLPKESHFHPIGIADRDGTADFFAPENDSHVSFSVAPGSRRADASPVTAEVLRLATIVERLGTPAPDVLKMDIEGFEYPVIDDLLSGEIRPRQLLVEFHHGLYDLSRDSTMRTVDHLRRAGYRMFHVSDTGREYGLVFAPEDQ